MNIINKIIILILIIIIINIITNGNLFNVLKNTFNLCKNNVEKFIILPNNNKYEYSTQKDFPYNYNIQNKIEEEDSSNLYNYLDNLVTKNVNYYEMTSSIDELRKTIKQLNGRIEELRRINQHLEEE